MNKPFEKEPWELLVKIESRESELSWDELMTTLEKEKAKEQRVYAGFVVLFLISVAMQVFSFSSRVKSNTPQEDSYTLNLSLYN